VYNVADAHLPTPVTLAPTLARNAMIGFGASAVADTVTNSIRVLKARAIDPAQRAAQRARDRHRERWSSSYYFAS
jgi:hypothetical protein